MEKIIGDKQALPVLLPHFKPPPSLIPAKWSLRHSDSDTSADICNDHIPQAVEDMSIGKDAQHDVVSGGVMDKGPLGVDKEDIGHPDLLHQTAVKRHALVSATSERKAFILPVVSQVEGHGEVLVQTQTIRRFVKAKREIIAASKDK